MTWQLNPHGVILPAAFADPAPVARPELGEVATTLDGRDITRGMVNPMLLETPDDTVLMQRGGGDYTVYREVLRDDHVKAALTQRIHAVIARPWEVRPGGEKRADKLAAADLEATLKRIRWDAITEKMLYGVFYGHAVGEAMWGIKDGRVALLDVRVRDRRRFGWDGAGNMRMKTMQKPDGELLPDRKFWAFATGADHDDAPYGLGLAHWLYWPVWLKRNGIRFWAQFLEKFGTPTAVGRFPPGTSSTDQNRLLSALRAIQRDSAIIFPEGMQAGLLEATRSGSADHAAFTSMMNAAILVITIGQTASTQGTPGKLGNDQEQADVRADITRADADLVCMSFNATIARWLTGWNHPGAAYPQVWRIMDEPEDMAQAAERDLTLSQVGFKPSLERVIEVYGEGYEAAAPGADSPAQAEFAAPVVQASSLPRGADEDVIDAAVAAELADWRQVADPLTAPIEAAMRESVAAGETAEQFLARLPGLLEQMDADPLAERLARLATVARLAGVAGEEP